jgi:hypothetical protein
VDILRHKRPWDELPRVAAWLLDTVASWLKNDPAPVLAGLSIVRDDPRTPGTASYDAARHTITIHNPIDLSRSLGLEGVARFMLPDFDRVAAGMFLIVLLHELVHAYQARYRCRGNRCDLESHAGHVAYRFAREHGLEYEFSLGESVLARFHDDFRSFYRCSLERKNDEGFDRWC